MGKRGTEQQGEDGANRRRHPRINREQGRQTADFAYARIKDFPLSLIYRIDEELLLSAASIKASFPLSYADSFAAATAQIYDVTLLTGDPAFKALDAADIISVQWLNSL